MGIMAATPVKAQYFRFCGNRYTADATIPLGGGTATWNQATTGISSVTADTPQGKRGIYTLDGMRLNGALDNLPAGIYIVDGRKVVK